MFSVNPPLNHNNYICFHQPLMRPNGHHSKVPQTKLIILNTPTRTHTHREREREREITQSLQCPAVTVNNRGGSLQRAEITDFTFIT